MEKLLRAVSGNVFNLLVVGFFSVLVMLYAAQNARSDSANKAQDKIIEEQGERINYKNDAVVRVLKTKVDKETFLRVLAEQQECNRDTRQSLSMVMQKLEDLRVGQVRVGAKVDMVLKDKE